MPSPAERRPRPEVPPRRAAGTGAAGRSGPGRGARRGGHAGRAGRAASCCSWSPSSSWPGCSAPATTASWPSGWWSSGIGRGRPRPRPVHRGDPGSGADAGASATGCSGSTRPPGWCCAGAVAGRGRPDRRRLRRSPSSSRSSRALALTFVLNGLAAQYRAGLTRDLRFGAVAGGDLARPAARRWPSRWPRPSRAPATGRWSPSSSRSGSGEPGRRSWRWPAGCPGRPRRGVGPAARSSASAAASPGRTSSTTSATTWTPWPWACGPGPTALGVYSRGFQLLMTPAEPAPLARHDGRRPGAVPAAGTTPTGSGTTCGAASWPWASPS